MKLLWEVLKVFGIFYAGAAALFFYAVPRTAHGGLRLDFATYFFLGATALSIFVFYRRKAFKYDSEGETLSFHNYRYLKQHETAMGDEFPKYKLISYNIINLLIFKKLIVTVESKRTKPVTLKYDISYLSKTEFSRLTTTLDEVLRANKENKLEIKLG